MIFALLSLLAVLGNLGLLPAATEAAADMAYELRSWEGWVGVFCPPDAQTPSTVTDIRVRDLPLADRLALTGGIRAEDYDEVVRLLEDFGS